MDKRALSAIPRPVLTDKNKEMLMLVPNMSYLVTATRQEVSGIDTLIINFFHAEKKGFEACISDVLPTRGLYHTGFDCG